MREKIADGKKRYVIKVHGRVLTHTCVSPALECDCERLDIMLASLALMPAGSELLRELSDDRRLVAFVDDECHGHRLILDTRE